MYNRKLRAAAMIIVVAVLASTHLTVNAAPPDRESPPVGGDGPVISTTMTDRTLVGLEADMQGTGAIDRFFAADAVLTLLDSGEQIRGRAAVADAIEGLCHDAFAGRMTVDSLIVDGDVGAVTGELIGTHIGVYQQTVATGATVRVPYTAIYEVANGVITTMRLDLSSAEVLRQLTVPLSSDGDGTDQSGRPF